VETLFLHAVDSTNEACRRRVRQGYTEPCLLLATEQHQGKGSRGRSWDSYQGGLYLTWYLGTSPDRMEVQSLTMVCAVGIYHALQDQGVDVTLKWPNDIMLHGKKIGGILAEYFEERGSHHLMVGVGINLMQHQEAFQNQTYRASSVWLETNISLSPMETAGPLVASMQKFKMLWQNHPQYLEWMYLSVLSQGKEEAVEHLRRIHETMA